MIKDLLKRRRLIKYFEESHYHIDFAPDDIVIKLDGHRYYKYVSGRGFKGVDFVVWSSGTLYLIEVKNYVRGNMPEETELANTFYQKAEDTMRLIEIIGKYYHKKVFKRWLYQWGLLHLFDQEASDWYHIVAAYNANQVVIIGDFNEELY